jgi:hypothetical protein
MAHEELLANLRALEVGLHRRDTRADPKVLGALLHPDFREFGRSGATFTRESTLAEFAEARQASAIWSQDYAIDLLAEGLALVTYRTAHVDAEGRLDRHTNRSSLWQWAEGRWLLRFHQGTPTQPFERATT